MMILKRIKLAWCAFWFIPCKVQINPFTLYSSLQKGYRCDNHYLKCENDSTVALAEKILTISIDEVNFYHVCDPCAEKFEGSKTKYFVS
jgi:hypothetical protein